MGTNTDKEKKLQESSFEVEQKNIYQKLLEVQKKIISLAKDKSSFNFKYVTGDKVLDYIKPIMNDQGLILKQEIIKVDKERIDYKVKAGEKSEMLYSVWQKFTWINCETGETDINEFFSAGMNDWEKGLGSALTYGERYFLLKYFHISTDEDDIDNSDRKEINTIPNKIDNKKIMVTDAQIKKFNTICSSYEIDKEAIKEYYKKSSTKDFTKEEMAKIIDNIEKKHSK